MEIFKKANHLYQKFQKNSKISISNLTFVFELAMQFTSVLYNLFSVQEGLL